MIEELLQRRYPNEYGLPAADVAKYAKSASGSLVLSDSKACMQCRSDRLERRQCNGENLKMDFGKVSVSIIDFEGYISQYDHTRAEVGNRCDYLLVDDETHKKVAFCDLTCSEERYVLPNGGKYRNGKKAKAKSQMKESLECLLRIPMFDHYLLTFPEKVCLFGWRDYISQEEKTRAEGAERSVLEFMKTPSSVASSLHTEVSVLGHGFDFVQVKYPSVYMW